MFDIEESGCAPDTTVPVPDDTAPAAGPAPDLLPLERVEAQLCELAGHLTAATCRFLVLLGDFDARRGWASWDMSSCAAWLSWKCQTTAGTAREHVRVARALRDLPVIRAEFGAGRLSYAKVRALTRIATPATEAGLAEIAEPMTGNQLERFARAHRQVSDADDATARVRRRLAWRIEEDGSLAGTFRLPPLQGAALLKALRAAAGDLEHPHDDQEGPAHPATQADVSAETPVAGQPVVATPASLADGLVAIAEAFLVGQVATAQDPEVYQVIVHVGTGALPRGGDRNGKAGNSASEDPAGVSAETPAGSAPAVPGHPADPARCHLEDGPAISARTAQMLAESAALSWMLHGTDGAILDLGRRRRRPNAALRRAARERDKCRCRFPGCESRRTDLHHIQYWSHGGRTKLTNLISLCQYHHMLVHRRGYLIAASPGSEFAFYRPDGTAIPASPALPTPSGTIGDCHDADITPETIVPPWYGERLDLDHAIYVCLANAARQDRENGRPSQEDPQDHKDPEGQDDPESQEDREDREGQDHPEEPFRPRAWVVNPFDWFRHYYDQHAGV